MSRVLMLSLVFGPDTVSTANMMTDLARGLQERGHQVTVLTSMPHYNPSAEVLGNRLYRAQFPTLLTETLESGVRILRVYMPLKRQRISRRVLDYLWFHVVTMLVGLIKIPQQDVVFVPSPPITLGVSGYLLAVMLKAKLIYDVRELWPDVPVRMGIIRQRILIRLVYAIEDFVYHRSAAITSIARGFIGSLTKRGVPNDKMFFTPNFVDVEWLTPRMKTNAFAREHNLDDKFVVLYAGNIGLTQGLEILVELGRELESDAQVVILAIGDGAGRPRLEKAMAVCRLKNIRLLPFQPYAKVPDSYATADVCISPMRSGFSYDTVPSKIYTAMAAGRAVVAACEADTESAQLLEESNAGLVVTPESSSEMAAAIRRIRACPEMADEMGQKGRQWIVKHYSKDAVIAVYDQVIRQIAQSAQR